MTFTINDLLLHYIGLVSIFSPVAAIVPFIGNTNHYSRKIQMKAAFRVALISFLFLIVGAWAGKYILQFLGISLPALRAAGGLILLLSSVTMVMKGQSPRKRNVETTDHDDWKSVVVVPLVFPFTIGAASLSYVITLMGTSESLIDYLVINGIILLDGLSIWLTYVLAVRLGKRISPTGSSILVRIGGIIVMAIGFSLLTTGLKGLLPGLG